MSNYQSQMSPVGDSSTARRVADAAHEAVDSAAARAEELEHTLRDKAGQAGDKLEASQKRAAEQIDRQVAELERFVQRRPMAAAGIAFAAGVLATALVRR